MTLNKFLLPALIFFQPFAPIIADAQESFIAPFAPVPGTYAAPYSADLDGNGTKEVYLATGNTIVGIEPNGQPKTGFPINLATLVGPQATVLPDEMAIADLNGDLQKEIIATILGVCSAATPACQKRVYAFTSSGTLYPGWPSSGIIFPSTEEITDKPVIAKLGNQNVVVVPIANSSTLTRRIKVINGQGVVIKNIYLDQFTFTQPREISLAVGDVDNDGYDEATAQTNNGLYLVDLNAGSIRTGFPISGLGSPTVWPMLPPAMADLDGDGHRDILAVDTIGVYPPISTTLRAFNRLGASLPGWPVTLPNVAPHGLASLLADVNADGLADVIFVGYDYGSASRKIWVFSNSGQLLPGWPFTAPSTIKSAFTAIDISNDGASEIFSSAASLPSMIPADYFLRVNPNGTLHSQLPLSQFAPGLPLIFQIGPAVTFEDLLGDGDAELFFMMKVDGLDWLDPGLPNSLNTLVSLDTYGSYPQLSNARRLKWPFVHADVQNTRSLPPALVTPTPTPTATATPTASPTATSTPSSTPTRKPTHTPTGHRPPIGPVPLMP